MDSLRSEQGNFKSTRQKTFDEMKRLQEGVQKKIKDAQASRGKMPYKSVAEVDQRIEWVYRYISHAILMIALSTDRSSLDR